MTKRIEIYQPSKIKSTIVGALGKGYDIRVDNEGYRILRPISPNSERVRISFEGYFGSVGTDPRIEGYLGKAIAYAHNRINPYGGQSEAALVGRSPLISRHLQDAVDEANLRIQTDRQIRRAA